MITDEYSAKARAARIYDARTSEYFAKVRGGYESADTWEMLRDSADSEEWTRRVVGLAISHYAGIANYNTAVRRFATAIASLLADFCYQECIDMIEKIQGNDQTHGRGRAYGDHRKLRARVGKMDSTFNPAAYVTFNRHFD